MTILMCVAVLIYAVLALVSLAIPLPFEVFLWGGLILIFGWWAHDAIHERKARRVVA